MTNKEKYIREVKALFPFYGKKEKQYIQRLKMDLDTYPDNTDYSEYIEQFDTPKKNVISYLKLEDDDELLKKMNTRKVVHRTMIIITIISITIALWFGVLLYAGYQYSKSQTPTQIETIIEEG